MPVTDVATQKRLPPVIEFVTNFELLQMIKEQPPVESYKINAFPTLNKNLDGFEAGELVVITGPGGTGKSLFCQTITKDFCENGHTPLWFTYEMSERQFLERFARNAEDLNFIMPKSLVANSIDFLCEAVKQAKERYETEIVFIDHLHYVFNMSNSKNVSLDIGVILRQLKRLALDLGVVIFLICHTNKARIESADDVGSHSIRDSSFTSQEPDVVLFIWAKITETDGVMENKQIIKICKSRRNGMMFKAIPIMKRENYLVELDTTNTEERRTRNWTD